MIAFDLDYYRPSSIIEAVDLYKSLCISEKEAIYYGGGTEFISMARMNNISADALIDIKGIPECISLERDGGKIIIGSGVTLTKIVESGIFPLLGKSAGRIADHTIQDKITLGGNICGTIIYKEAVLPLLLSECKLLIAGVDGCRAVPLNSLFNKSISLSKGEFIAQAIVDEEYADLPYAHVKRTKQDKIDYPLITAAALKKDDSIRIAFSGLFRYPFRSQKVEKELNNFNITEASRIDNIIDLLHSEILEDDLGSREYREFVLANIVKTIYERF